jgi:hypothetical protein
MLLRRLRRKLAIKEFGWLNNLLIMTAPESIGYK